MRLKTKVQLHIHDSENDAGGGGGSDAAAAVEMMETEYSASVETSFFPTTDDDDNDIISSRNNSQKKKNKNKNNMAVNENILSSSLILENLQTMRRQEEEAYTVKNYFLRDLHLEKSTMAEHHKGKLDSGNGNEFPIDPECRFRMSEWCYQVSDHCKLQRETVAIAMSCLDRFLDRQPPTSDVFQDRDQFQLASMVCYYTCVKVHDVQAMNAHLIAKLSRGMFTAEQVERMERRVLLSIGFRVNPPTALTFCKHLLNVLFHHPSNPWQSDRKIGNAILELAKFQTEIAVGDAVLMCVPPSLIALASLMNALESLHMDETTQNQLAQILFQAAGLELDESHFQNVRMRLYEGLSSGGQAQQERNGNLSTATPSASFHSSLFVSHLTPQMTMAKDNDEDDDDDSTLYSVMDLRTYEESPKSVAQQ